MGDYMFLERELLLIQVPLLYFCSILILSFIYSSFHPKCVSKSWHAITTTDPVIKNELMLPQPSSGFFYKSVGARQYIMVVVVVVVVVVAMIVLQTLVSVSYPSFRISW